MKNLYELQDEISRLFKRGWKKSSLDNCLFTKRDLIFILYVDDACIIYHSKYTINNEINHKRNCDYANDRELHDYLWVRFDRSPDGSVTLTQLCMVARVLDIVGLLSGSNIKMHDTPVAAILNSNSK